MASEMSRQRTRTASSRRDMWKAHGVTWRNGRGDHGVSIQMTWNQQVLDALRSLPVEVSQDLAREAMEKARTLAPEDTGRMRGSLSFRKSRYGGLVRTNVGRIPRGAKGRAVKWRRKVYPVFVEFGTVKTAAKPFMRPAKEWAESQFLNRARRRFAGIR